VKQNAAHKAHDGSHGVHRLEVLEIEVLIDEEDGNENLNKECLVAVTDAE